MRRQTIPATLSHDQCQRSQGAHTLQQVLASGFLILGYLLAKLMRKFGIQRWQHGQRIERELAVDIDAAQAVGAKPVLVRTGKGAGVVKSGALPAGVEVHDDLAAFVDALLARY